LEFYGAKEKRRIIMTKLEQLIQDYLTLHCPDDYFDDGVRFDKRTEMKDEHGNRIGCRGITCEQCWNKEIEE